MKRILTIIVILTVVFLISNQKQDRVMIPKDAIRFRVIANSNSKKDQEDKKIVVKELQDEVFKTLKNKNSLTESRLALRSNINNFKQTTELALKSNNIEDEYKINYGMNYFPEKEYKGVIYPEGKYESLVVTLGKGEGNNFWCVLFPPLCLLEAEDENKTNVEYSSFVKELIDKYF